MTTASTTLLGLALPVTGELSGTWGDVVNASLTNLLDTAIAGTTTLSSDADVTLTTTTLSANQARQAVILWTAGGTATRTITAPAQSKSYVVINATSSSQSIKLVGVGPTTGITIVAGEKCFAAWNGTDFVKVGNTSGAGVFSTVTASSLTSGRVTYAGTAGLLQDSANLTFNGNLIIGSAPAYTPDATWNGTFAFATGSFGSFSTNTHVAQNGYWNAGWKYLTSAGATNLYLHQNGVFLFRSAAAGVAGDTITWTTVADIRATNAIFYGGINSTAIGATTPSTGAFTTLSASGETLIGGAQTLSAGLGVKNASATSTTTGDNKIIRLAANASGADVTLSFTDTASYNSSISAKANHLLLQPVAGTVVGDFSSTGLAVTGTLSATKPTTIGDVITFTSGAASSKTGYLYVNTTSVVLSGAANGGSGMCNIALSATGLTLYGPDQTKTAVLDNTGLAVTGTLSATTTGKVGTTLGVGAATPSASGAGITFPATQSASTDANTLDDYEEGTWTPSFLAVSGSATYTNQQGTYTKIGKQVTAVFYITVNVSSSLTSENITGLPFTASGNYAGAALSAWSNIGGFCTIIGLVSSTNIQLRSTNSATGAPVVNTLTISNGTEIAGSVTYFTS